MARFDTSFDATSVEPTTAYELLPAGKYRAQIVESEMRVTKNGMGQFLWLMLDILEGEHKGRKIFDQLNLVNPNPTTVEIAQRTLSAICHATGKMQVGWLSWERIVRAWDAAQGSDEAIKAFRNTILGETWVETGEAPDWQRLYDRRERWTSGMVPAGGLFLTAGADVQKDRIEVDVWAWGRGLESWLVDHVVIEGGPDRHDAWSELTALLDRSWPHERGAHLRIARLAIDTGYEAPAVYSWSRAQGFAQVSPVKGVEGFNRSSPVSGPTFVDATEGGKRLRRGARLWTVAVSTFKAETYRFLRLARPTEEDTAEGAAFSPGSVHLPHWVENEWLKQFVAEQLVTVRTKRGFARLEWQKLRERNEALDCRVYARAAAWIAGADRWPDEKWRDLEDQLGAAPTDTDPAGQINRPGQAPQGKRRSDWLGRRGGWF